MKKFIQYILLLNTFLTCFSRASREDPLRSEIKKVRESINKVLNKNTMSSGSTLSSEVASHTDAQGSIHSISQQDLGANGLIINEPGVYRVSENLEFNPTSPDHSAINIEANCVSLNLNGHCLMQNGGATGSTGVRISADLSHVTVENGTIEKFSQFGIGVQGGSQNVTLRSVTIKGCGTVTSTDTAAIAIASATNFTITDCHLLNNFGTGFSGSIIRNGNFKNIEILGTRSSRKAIGCALSDGVNINVLRCSFCQSTARTAAIGLSCDTVNTFLLEDTRLSQNSSEQSSIGAHIENSTNVFIKNCHASQNSVLSRKGGLFGPFALVQGFFVHKSENLIMRHCTATENNTTGDGAGTARGFDLFGIKNGHYTKCHSSKNIGKAGTVAIEERLGSPADEGCPTAPRNHSPAESVGFSLFFNDGVIVNRCTAVNNSIKKTKGFSDGVSIGFLVTDVTGVIDSCESSFHGTERSINPNHNGVGFLLNNAKSGESFLGSQLIVQYCIAQNNLAFGFRELSRSSSIAFLNNSAESNITNFSLLSTNGTANALIPIDSWIIGTSPPSLSTSKWANYDLFRYTTFFDR